MLNTFNPNDAQRRHREVTFVAKMEDSLVTQPKHDVLQRMTGDIRRSLGPLGAGKKLHPVQVHSFIGTKGIVTIGHQRGRRFAHGFSLPTSSAKTLLALNDNPAFYAG